jgi:hypothetical protein
MFDRAMSATGHKRTLPTLYGMSALPRERTLKLSRAMSAINRRHRPPLLHGVVGAGKHRRRNVEVARLGDLEIDHGFVPWPSNGTSTGLLPLRIFQRRFGGRSHGACRLRVGGCEMSHLLTLPPSLPNVRFTPADSTGQRNTF